MATSVSFFVLVALFTFVTCNPYGGLAVLSSCDADDKMQLWKYNSTFKSTFFPHGSSLPFPFFHLFFVFSLDIVHVATGFCLDVQSKETAAGTPVQIYQCMYDNRKNQKWEYNNSTVSFRSLSSNDLFHGCAARTRRYFREMSCC